MPGYIVQKQRKRRTDPTTKCMLTDLPPVVEFVKHFVGREEAQHAMWHRLVGNKRTT